MKAPRCWRPCCRSHWHPNIEVLPNGTGQKKDWSGEERVWVISSNGPMHLRCCSYSLLWDRGDHHPALSFLLSSFLLSSLELFLPRLCQPSAFALKFAKTKHPHVRRIREEGRTGHRAYFPDRWEALRNMRTSQLLFLFLFLK